MYWAFAWNELVFVLLVKPLTDNLFAVERLGFIRILLPSAAFCLLMVGAAAAVAAMAGVDGRHLVLDYLLPAAALALVLVLAWAFATVISLARMQAPAPLAELRKRLPARLELLVLPVVVTPIFYAAFTTAKSGLWRLTGYRWDRAFTDLDATIFGTDPWRLTHALLGPGSTQALEIFYTAAWGLGLACTNILVAMNAPRRLVGVYFLATFSCWFLNGFVLAYLLSSAGPVFAHLSDPALAARFAPMVESLDRLLDPNSPIRLSQAYLYSAVDSAVLVRGGGISAMPSMHIASIAVLVMAARGSRWIWLALPSLILTWIGSVHFGYHYAIDGLLAVPVAIVCWKCAERVFADARLDAAPDVSVALIGSARS